MQNILVPTDFSEEATNALEVAVEIAKLSKGKVTLFHVVDAAPSISPFNVAGDYASPVTDNLYLTEILESSKSKLEEIVKQHQSDFGGMLFKVALGGVSTSIEAETLESKIDLIVMGSKGTSGLEEYLIGSNTEKVVRKVKCPVLTIKKKLNSFSVKDIVFAANPEEDQGIVVNKVKKFQSFFNSTIHLVKINTPDSFGDTPSIKQKLKEFVQRYQLENYTINIYDSKSAEEGINNFAEEMNANLIAMGTHGRTGIAHLIAGSVAEDVVNHATRMVLTINMTR